MNDFSLAGYSLCLNNVPILLGSHVSECCGAVNIRPANSAITKEQLYEYLKILDQKYEDACYDCGSQHNSAAIMVSTTLDMNNIPQLHPVAKNLWIYERELLYPYKDEDDEEEYYDED